MGLQETFRAFSGSASGIVEKTFDKRPELGPHEVAIRVTHSGVCSTDLHHTHDDMVLGHEGVGVVDQVGAEVTKFKPNQRVGFGYVWGGCGECENCKIGRYYYCQVSPRQYARTDPDTGSWSTYAILPDQVLMHVPDIISSAEAAPFMCAGMTVFTPMKRFGVGKEKRVGITGIGGLGHLAIQFAAKLGAEVVVFSTSENKRDEAAKFGATEFYVSGDLDKSKPSQRLDYLIVTGTRFPDWDVFFPLLNHHAQIMLVGFSPEQLTLPFWPLMMSEISVHGCLTSTPDEFASMLKFAADHGVKPVIEEFPMTTEGVAQAVEKLEKGTIRYRGVLVV
ncbi:uncharacterized protein PV09_05091 [Verruconis gallopava]|uniref:Enoyl reductase (ER) domain-containing protein n=1 Tax=Verruconis gallopava TaxID=253628 RepID=A0A0D2AAI6_9PEZI|nr:uncharacterized protein PV09_05091 [Verruconis gallopava]KIW03788.1 hypothetical protein PV09_05091 [Verruconis gallopava]